MNKFTANFKEISKTEIEKIENTHGDRDKSSNENTCVILVAQNLVMGHVKFVDQKFDLRSLGN